MTPDHERPASAGRRPLPPDRTPLKVTRRLRPSTAVRPVSIAVGWAMLAYCVLTSFEVVGRKFFGFSFQGVDEYAGYLLAVIASVGYTAALVARMHTRVDIFTSVLPSRAKGTLNVAAHIALTGMAAFFTWQAWIVVRDTVRYQSHAPTPLQTPLVWPQGLWFGLLVLFVIVTALVSGHAFKLLWTDRARLEKLYGSRSVSDQIEHEVGNLPLDRVKSDG